MQHQEFSQSTPPYRLSEISARAAWIAATCKSREFCDTVLILSVSRSLTGLREADYMTKARTLEIPESHGPRHEPARDEVFPWLLEPIKIASTATPGGPVGLLAELHGALLPKIAPVLNVGCGDGLIDRPNTSVHGLGRQRAPWHPPALQLLAGTALGRGHHRAPLDTEDLAQQAGPLRCAGQLAVRPLLAFYRPP